MFGALTAKLFMDSSGFVRGLASAEKGLDKFEKRMRGVPNNVDRLKQRMDILGDSAIAVGGASAALGAGLLLSAKKALSAGGDLEKYRSVLLTLYEGNQEVAEEGLKWATDFANRTPYLTDQVIQSYVKLEAYGINAKDSLKTIGDTAAGMGKDIMQAVEAIADARQGEFERLKEFGIKASVEGDKVRFRYSKNGKDMVAEADKNSSEMIASTIQGIWNSKYDGAMERMSTTWQGLVSTLGGLWWSLWAKVGEAGVLDAAKEQIEKLIDYVGSESATKTAEKLGKALGDLIKIGGRFIELGLSAIELLSPVLPLLTKLAAGTSGLGGALLLHSKVLPKVLDLYSGGAKVWTRFSDSVETSRLKLMLQSDALKMSAKNATGFTRGMQNARAKTAQFAGSSQAAGVALQAGLAVAIAFTMNKLIKLNEAYREYRKIQEEIKKDLEDSSRHFKSQRTAILIRDAKDEIEAYGDVQKFTKKELKKLVEAGFLEASEYDQILKGQNIDSILAYYEQVQNVEKGAVEEAQDRTRDLEGIVAEREKLMQELQGYGETYEATDISALESFEDKVQALNKDIKDLNQKLHPHKRLDFDEHMGKLHEVGLISDQEYLEHRKGFIEELKTIFPEDVILHAEYANDTKEIEEKIASDREKAFQDKLEFDRRRLKYGEIGLEEYQSILENELQILEEQGQKYSDIYQRISDELLALTEQRNAKLSEANQNLATDFEAQADNYLELSNMIGSSLAGGQEGMRELLKNSLLWMVKAIRQKLILAQVSALAEAIASGGLSLPKALAQLPQLALLNTMLSAAESGITSLASGGIVKKEILAMVGDNPRSPEVVSPLHELLPMITGAVREGLAGLSVAGAGGPIVIQVPVTLDGRQIAFAQAEYDGSRRK